MQTLEIPVDEQYLDEARKLGIIDKLPEFLNRSLIEFVRAKRKEMEPQQILDGLKEAVDDVKNQRVSSIDTLWDSIDD